MIKLNNLFRALYRKDAKQLDNDNATSATSVGTIESIFSPSTQGKAERSGSSATDDSRLLNAQAWRVFSEAGAFGYLTLEELLTLASLSRVLENETNLYAKRRLGKLEECVPRPYQAPMEKLMANYKGKFLKQHQVSTQFYGYPSYRWKLWTLIHKVRVPLVSKRDGFGEHVAPGKHVPVVSALNDDRKGVSSKIVVNFGEEAGCAIWNVDEAKNDGDVFWKSDVFPIDTLFNRGPTFNGGMTGAKALSYDQKTGLVLMHGYRISPLEWVELGFWNPSNHNEGSCTTYNVLQAHHTASAHRATNVALAPFNNNGGVAVAQLFCDIDKNSSLSNVTICVSKKGQTPEDLCIPNDIILRCYSRHDNVRVAVCNERWCLVTVDGEINSGPSRQVRQCSHVFVYDWKNRKQTSVFKLESKSTDHCFPWKLVTDSSSSKKHNPFLYAHSDGHICRLQLDEELGELREVSSFEVIRATRLNRRSAHRLRTLKYLEVDVHVDFALNLVVLCNKQRVAMYKGNTGTLLHSVPFNSASEAVAVLPGRHLYVQSCEETSYPLLRVLDSPVLM